MRQALKIPAAKCSGGQGMGKLDNFGVEPDESKKEVIDEARTSGATVHFASLIDMSLEKC